MRAGVCGFEMKTLQRCCVASIGGLTGGGGGGTADAVMRPLMTVVVSTEAFDDMPGGTTRSFKTRSQAPLSVKPAAVFSAAIIASVVTF